MSDNPIYTEALATTAERIKHSERAGRAGGVWLPIDEAAIAAGLDPNKLRASCKRLMGGKYYCKRRDAVDSAHANQVLERVGQLGAVLDRAAQWHKGRMMELHRCMTHYGDAYHAAQGLSDDGMVALGAIGDALALRPALRWLTSVGILQEPENGFGPETRVSTAQAACIIASLHVGGAL